MTDSSPLLDVGSIRRKNMSVSVSSDMESLDFAAGGGGGGIRGSAKRASIRNRQFMSMTKDQMDKASDLAAILRTQPAKISEEMNQIQKLSLDEKMSLLRKQSPSSAASMLQSFLTQIMEEGGGTKEEISSKLSGLVTEQLKLSYELKHTERQWNEEFQAFLEMEDGVEKYSFLRMLYSDFCYAADAYGRIIISERHLPVDMKTIKPASIGGIAGGEKYICHSILFKFAVDQEVNGGWMYGGSEPSDEAAMKVASNELTGLIHCFKCEVKGLHLPLMTLIDYRGYRLSAFSVLPVDKSTLVYGSDDGGKTVLNKTKLFASKMEQVANVLNLMGHNVHGVRVHGPADLEGHRGKDGRMYLLDFSRVFPPEAPEPGAKDSRAIFHRLLRPELVKRSDIPLSSDAFSKFQKDDPKDKALNGQVHVATEMLFREIIPQFALSLSELKSFDDLMLIGSIHRAGINVRHLGKLRKCVDPKATEIRRILLSQMCARCIKVLFRAAMRETMKEYCLPSVEPYTAVILDLLNLIFGWGFEGAIFWKSVSGTVPKVDFVTMPIHTIKETLQRKFLDALSEEEMKEQCDLRDQIDLKYVLTLLQKMLNLTLSASAVESLLSENKTFMQLSHNDILGLGAKIKDLPIIDYYSGIQLSLAAMSKMGDEHRRLIQLAEQRFRSTLATLPDHAPTYFQWGKLIHAQAVKSGNRDMGLFANSLQKLKMALDMDPMQQEFQSECVKLLLDYGKSLLSQALAKKNKGLLRQASDKFKEAVRLQPVSVSRQLVDIVQETLKGVTHDPKSSENEFVYEAMFTLVDVSRKNKDAGALHAKLHLDWGFALAFGITFQDVPKDSGRVLQAAEKIRASWSENTEESQAVYLKLVETVDTFDLCKMFALSKLVDPLREPISKRCALATQFRFCDLKGLTDNVLVDICEASPNLTELIVRNCPSVSDAAVSSCVKKLKNLSIFCLAGCLHLSHCFMEVAKYSKSLKVLDLTLCFVTDEMLKVLSCYAMQLERVSVGRTRVSGEGCSVLLKAAKNLAVLDLTGCGNVGDKFVTSVPQNGLNLQTLIMSSCAQLTNKSCVALAKSSKLNLLDLSHCDKIEDKGFAALLKSDSLTDLFIKGVHSRMEEKTLKKLSLVVNCIMDKTVAELVGVLTQHQQPTSGMTSPRSSTPLLYDLNHDFLVTQTRSAKKSPRKFGPRHSFSNVLISTPMPSDRVTFEYTEEEELHSPKEQKERSQEMDKGASLPRLFARNSLSLGNRGSRISKKLPVQKDRGGDDDRKSSK